MTLIRTRKAARCTALDGSHAGNSRDPRPPAAAAPVQGGTARGLPRSDERHLVVLVWIAGTREGLGDAPCWYVLPRRGVSVSETLGVAQP